MAQISINQNNITETVEILEKIRKLDKNYNPKLISQFLANLYFQQKQFKQSLENYLIYYDFLDYDERENILYKIAKCQIILGQFEKAKQTYFLAIQINLKNYRSHMKLGWIMVVYGVSEKIIQEGIDHLKTAYSLNKTNFKLLLRLADSRLLIEGNNNFYRESIETYNNLLNLLKDDQYEKLKNQQKITQDDQKQYEKYCYLGLSKAYEKLKNYKSSIEYTKKVLDFDDLNQENKEQYLLFLALLYKKQQNEIESLKTLKQILIINKYNVPALIEYAEFSAQNGSFQKTKQLLRSAQKQDPQNIIVNFRLGQLYQLIFEDLVSAKLCYQKVIDAKPDLYIGHYLQGQCCYELLEFDKAFQHLFKTLELEPKFLNAWKYMGRIFLEKEKYDKAIKFYSKAIFLDPSDIELKRKIADIYYFNNNYESAIQMFQQLLENDEYYQKSSTDLNQLEKDENLWDKSELEYNIANCYYNLEDYDNAKIHYKNALQINPNYEECLYNMGNLESIKLDFDQAIQYFHQCYEMFQNQAALFNEANCYAIQKNSRKAKKLYQELLENDICQHIDWLIQIIDFFIGEEMFEQSEKYLKQYIDQNQNNSNNNNKNNLILFTLLSKILLEMKKKEEAIEYLKKAYEIDDNHDQVKTLLFSLSYNDQSQFKFLRRKSKKSTFTQL